MNYPKDEILSKILGFMPVADVQLGTNWNALAEDLAGPISVLQDIVAATPESEEKAVAMKALSDLAWIPAKLAQRLCQ